MHVPAYVQHGILASARTHARARERERERERERAREREREREKRCLYECGYRKGVGKWGWSGWMMG